MSETGDTTRIHIDDATRVAPFAEEDSFPASANGHPMSLEYTRNFSIRGVIGQGGIGRVYLGFDKNIGREVAIKELLDQQEGDGRPETSLEFRKRFIREAKITGQLEHPSIIPVYEAGSREDGKIYYAMRYIRGKTMEDALKECEAGSQEVAFRQRMKLLDALMDVCEAVAYAHSKGIIHRDIKPSNIILGGFGETILIDWGLAKLLEQGESTLVGDSTGHTDGSDDGDMTVLGDIIGTPLYMAPEQTQGQSSKRSDVYSLGVILFRIMTGELPYRGGLNGIVAALQNDKPSPSPRDLRADIPLELATICEKAMAKDPFQRFSDAKVMIDQLHAYRDGRLVSVHAYTRRELLQRFIARNRKTLAALAIMLVAIIVGAGLAFRYALQAEQARAKAEAALVDITRLSELALEQSRRLAQILNVGLDLVLKDMDQAARKLAEMDVGDSTQREELLSSLTNRHPRLEPFTITPVSQSRSWPQSDLDDKESEAAVRVQPSVEDGRVLIHLRATIVNHGAAKGVLETVLRLEKVMPEILSQVSNIGKQRLDQVVPELLPQVIKIDNLQPNVFLMQDDGLVLYDMMPQYVAANMYNNSLNAYSPSLVAFCLQTKAERSGIGYYFIHYEDKQAVVQKVAAWDTVELPGGLPWRVIVNYPYRVLDRNDR